jgi:hypothetical protein
MWRGLLLWGSPWIAQPPSLPCCTAHTFPVLGLGDAPVDLPDLKLLSLFQGPVQQLKAVVQPAGARRVAGGERGMGEGGVWGHARRGGQAMAATACCLPCLVGCSSFWLTKSSRVRAGNTLELSDGRASAGGSPILGGGMPLALQPARLLPRGLRSVAGDVRSATMP